MAPPFLWKKGKAYLPNLNSFFQSALPSSKGVPLEETLGRLAVLAKRVSWQLHSNLHLDTNFCRFISGNEDFLINGKNSLGVTKQPTVILDKLELTRS